MALSVLEISSPDDVADAVVSHLLLGLACGLSLRLKIWKECSFSFKFWESNLNLKKREKIKEEEKNEVLLRTVQGAGVILSQPYHQRKACTRQRIRNIAFVLPPLRLAYKYRTGPDWLENPSGNHSWDSSVCLYRILKLNVFKKELFINFFS
jgi:hypothetical protein